MTFIKQLFNLVLRLIIVVAVLYPGYVSGQEKSAGITLNGYLKDSGNGESLIGATIYIRELSRGTVTNEYGFYSLTIPAGNYTIDFSYIGYEAISREIELYTDQRHDLELDEEVMLAGWRFPTRNALDAEMARLGLGQDMALNPDSPTPEGGITQFAFDAPAGEEATAMSLLPAGWYLMDVLTNTYGVSDHVWRADVMVEVVEAAEVVEE